MAEHQPVVPLLVSSNEDGKSWDYVLTTRILHLSSPRSPRSFGIREFMLHAENIL